MPSRVCRCLPDHFRGSNYRGVLFKWMALRKHPLVKTIYVSWPCGNSSPLPFTYTGWFGNNVNSPTFVTTTFVAGAPIDGLPLPSDVWSIGYGIFINWQSSDVPVTTGGTMPSTTHGTIPSTITQTTAQPTSQNIPTFNYFVVSIEQFERLRLVNPCRDCWLLYNC